MLLGLVFLIIGIWGFFTEDVLGVFDVNNLHSGVHVVFGLLGIYAGTKGKGKGYNGSVGWIYGILGVLGFVPGVKDILEQLLYVNAATNGLHLVIGIVSLLVYYTAK